jgi:large subunit ribosomal protein L9
MARVKLLLNESIKNVGRVGDVVEVSPGYARNYLLPKGLAVEPTPANVRRVEERRKEVERMERERRDQQEALIRQVQGTEITLERRANEQGHLFGSVSATDIARTLQALGFNIQPDDISLPGRLDRVDTYIVQVRFAEDLVADIKVWVAPDAESKAAIEAAQKAEAAEQAASDGQSEE